MSGIRCRSCARLQFADDPVDDNPIVCLRCAEEMRDVWSAGLRSDVTALRAENERLRAEVERLRKALRASTRELQYIAECDPCDKFHQSGEGRACVALAERILGPMYLWPDEPNLSAPAEEEGRDA